MKKLYILTLLLFSITNFSQTYNFSVYNSTNSNIGFNTIKKIKVASNGYVWAISDYNSGENGIAVFNGTSWTNFNTSNSGIQTNTITDIDIDSQNRIWLGTYQNGIIVYNGSTWVNYTTSNSPLPSNSINDINVDTANSIWSATTNGLAKYNGTNWQIFNTSNSNIGSNNITSVANNSQNYIYIVNDNILRQFEGATFSFTPFADQILKINKIIGADMYVSSFQGFQKYLLTDIVYNYSFSANNTCMIDCIVSDVDVDENDKV